MKLFILLTLVFAAALAAPSIIENGDIKITNGHEAVPHSHPYIVVLKASGSFVCGASILSEEWILTAAHCVMQFSQGQMSISAGVHDRTADDEDTQDIRAAEFFHHEGWNLNTAENDIALLRLETPLEFNENVAEISGIAPLEPAPGTPVTMMGWGTHRSAFSAPSDVLYEAESVLADRDVCNDYFTEYKVDERQVCVDTRDDGVCSGDSGSPMMADGKQVGVASFVEGFICIKSQYAGYTQVAQFADWICDNSGICL